MKDSDKKHAKILVVDDDVELADTLTDHLLEQGYFAAKAYGGKEALDLLQERDFHYTKNLKLRFEEHCKGLVESTKDRRPLVLVYYEACLMQEDATKREKYLKTYLGKQFLHNRLKSYLTG
jgi:putative endonuclease